MKQYNCKCEHHSHFEAENTHQYGKSFSWKDTKSIMTEHGRIVVCNKCYNTHMEEYKKTFPN